MDKGTFGVIVSSRSLFPMWLAEEGRKDIIKKLNALGYQYVILPEDATAGGVVETYSDAKRCAALFAKHREEIDGILVILPNFGDETAVADAIAMADLNVPVMVQACDDDIEKMELSHRRDSFCGKLSVCNNLYQSRIKFTDTTFHSCSIDSEEFTRDLDYFARVCRVVKGVRKARIGAIGARPSAFRTVRFSEKLLQASGITVVTIDLSDIIALAKRKMEDERVPAVVEEMRQYGDIVEGATEEKMAKQAGFYLAVSDWLSENECCCSAIQCWDSLENNFGIASCLTMSMLGEKGMPSACEMDITGALTMYALSLASGVPSGYLDWNNGFSTDRDKCSMIHYSNYPKSFMGVTPQIGNLDIMSMAVGAEKCFGACKGVIAPGPVTYSKISTDDILGKIKLYVGEGAFTDDPVKTPGGPGIMQVKGLQGLLKQLCQRGFEHHVAMNRSSSANIIEEALGKYLGWDVFRYQA